MKRRCHCDLCRDGVSFDPAFVHPPRHARDVEHHLVRHVGPISSVFYAPRTDLPRIHIYVVDPSPGRPFYVLATAGLSDLPMRPPVETGADLAWAEVALCLPEDWRMDRLIRSEDRWAWPLRLLLALVRYPHEEDAWIWYHHTFRHHQAKPFFPSLRFNGALLQPPRLLPDEFSRLAVAGKEIRFLLVVPIHPAEWDCWKRQSPLALVTRLCAAGVTELFDPKRESVADAVDPRRGSGGSA